MAECPLRLERSVICSPSSSFDHGSILPFVLEKTLAEED
jgi:hypothetical protein